MGPSGVWVKGLGLKGLGQGLGFQEMFRVQGSHSGLKEKDLRIKVYGSWFGIAALGLGTQGSGLRAHRGSVKGFRLMVKES